MTESAARTALAVLGRPRLWLGLAVLTLVAPVAHQAYDWFRIDSCLDAGGVFDYVQEQCRTDVVSLPVISYSTRHPPPGAGSLIAGVLVGVAGVLQVAKLRG